MQYRAALSRISHAKSHKQSPQDVVQLSDRSEDSRVWQRSMSGTKTRLRQANALDFDDLLLEAVRLLQHERTTREQYNRRYEFLMIDEYQDTNRTPV